MRIYPKRFCSIANEIKRKVRQLRLNRDSLIKQMHRRLRASLTIIINMKKVKAIIGILDQNSLMRNDINRKKLCRNSVTILTLFKPGRPFLWVSSEPPKYFDQHRLLMQATSIFLKQV